jgi:uncharacterized protein YodC (DUF2158 family)
MGGAVHAVSVSARLKLGGPRRVLTGAAREAAVRYLNSIGASWFR